MHKIVFFPLIPESWISCEETLTGWIDVVCACGARLDLRFVAEGKPSKLNLSSLRSSFKASSGQACTQRRAFISCCLCLWPGQTREFLCALQLIQSTLMKNFTLTHCSRFKARLVVPVPILSFSLIKARLVKSSREESRAKVKLILAWAETDKSFINSFTRALTKVLDSTESDTFVESGGHEEADSSRRL